MTKSEELNVLIAKYFGFKVTEEYSVGGLPQWTYPDDWYMLQNGIPNTSIPDFLKILEDYMKLLEEHGGYGKRECFGKLGLKPYPRNEVTKIRSLVVDGKVCIITEKNK